MYNNPYKAYQKTQITTAKPEKILLMLYEGAIKFIRIAATRMREKNIPEKGKYISKTIAIVSELMNTLDHEAGGQLAADLENLYVFMIDQMIDANLNNKVENLENVERLLTTLYSAWEDVINNPRQDGVPSQKLQPDLYAAWENASKQSEGTATPASKAPAAPTGGTFVPAQGPGKIAVPPRKAS